MPAAIVKTTAIRMNIAIPNMSISICRAAGGASPAARPDKPRLVFSAFDCDVASDALLDLNIRVLVNTLDVDI